jgi:hypothetical protein
MHPRTATEKDGKRYRWDRTRADDVDLVLSLYLGAYYGITNSEIWQISPFHNYNTQGFLRRLFQHRSVLIYFPEAFRKRAFERSASRELMQGRGGGSTCSNNKSSSRKKERKNNTNNINKVTPRKSTRKTIKPLNPRSPPMPDTDYVSSDDEIYDFRAELDDRHFST